jgi:hypothetical protein
MPDRTEPSPRPIDLFYRVRFPSTDALREWSLRVLEVMSLRQDVAISTSAARPVVFVPLKAAESNPADAYVSDGALGLASDFIPGGELDGTTTPLRDLPDGLNLLVGRRDDATAYEQRVRG